MTAGSPLIGREAELAALATALDGDRATVLVGEAGIGKTALVRAVATRLDRTTREGGAFATLRGTPYIALRRAVDAALQGDPSAVAAQLEQRIGPDLLFVDDAQWADEATLEVLGLLVGRIAVVTTIRSLDPGAAATLARLEAAGATVQVVEPLATDAARELVARRRPQLSERVVDDIVRRAAGNPLLLEEMADGGEATPLLARILTSRLEQLSVPARETVELLAVAERPLALELLPGAVSEAIDVGIAVASSRGLEVRHQLVGDAIRERLDEASRRRLHAQMAELSTDRAEVVRHLAAAGRTHEAAAAAMEGLAEATDPRERAALLVIAAETSPAETGIALRLEAARALDEIPDWASVVSVLQPVVGLVEGNAFAEAHALLAHATFSMGDIGTARGHLAAMEEPAIEPGSAAAVRRAIEAATFLVNVEGAVEAAIGRLDAASAAMAPGSPGVEDLAALRAAILLLAAGTGDVDRIRAAADGAFDAGRYRTATDRGRVVQYFLNMAVGAEAAFAFLVDRHARYDAAGLGSAAHDFLADAVVAAMLSGRLREALTIADRLLEEPAAPRARQTAGIYRARALVLLGRIDEGEVALEGLRGTATADYFGLGDLLTAQAEAALWGGRPDLAREHAQAALAVPAPLPIALAQAHIALAWADRELGRMPSSSPEVDWAPSTAGTPIELAALAAAAAGLHAEAAEGFTAAAGAWGRFHEPRALFCRWAAAEARAATGDRVVASDELGAALETAERIGFEPLAARIRRSLRLLGVRVAPKPAAAQGSGLGLTAREAELVALVERGLTNVEIARRLGLGRPTVARILGSAMAKLGVGSRVELAATVRA
jgi:DNA-binding CsgD family transcriptional regulator